MLQIVKYALLFLNALFRRDTSPKVVFYHDVGTKYTPMGTPEDLFWSHMAYLQELTSTLHSTTTTTNYNFPPHSVAFDDGFRGIWDHREAMRLFNVHPTVFIAIDLVGKPGYLTWDEIRTLQNEYGFNFHSHTWSHQTLIGPVNTDLPTPSDPNFRTDAWYHHELVDSKAELERQLNEKVVVRSGSGRKEESIIHSTTTTTNYNSSLHHTVTSLCFPVGYFSDDVIRRCAAAGYTTLYASFPGNKDGNSILPLQLPTPTKSELSILPLQLPTTTKLCPRILCQSLSLFAFKCVLRGGMNPLKKHYLKRHYINTPQL